MITLTIEDKQIEHIFIDEFHSNKEKFFEFIKLSFDSINTKNKTYDEDWSHLEADFDEGVASGMCEQSHDEIFDELLKNMPKIRYTKKAKSDLDGIFANIFQDKQDTAVEYIYKIKEFIALLQSNQFMGIECKHKGFNRDCRMLIFKNYLVQYKVFDDYVNIIRIRNSKQNLRR